MHHFLYVMDLPAGTRRPPPLWIYRRRNSGVLTATQSCLSVSSLPLRTRSCDCMRRQLIPLLQNKSPGLPGTGFRLVFFLFFDPFGSQFSSLFQFAVTLFFRRPAVVYFQFLILSAERFSASFSASVFQVSAMLPNRLLGSVTRHCRRAL